MEVEELSSVIVVRRNVAYDKLQEQAIREASGME
jgi:hypothetical protein